jgi:hypothetical protein
MITFGSIDFETEISTFGTGALPAHEIVDPGMIPGPDRHTELHFPANTTRVLDPRFALTTRSSDIGRARARIVSCESDGQARYRPR